MSVSPIPFSEALRFWLKLGFISFGGPAGQIAIMHQALVEQRGWISERRFLHALNYCMLLPGPEAQQLATYIGWLMHGVRGGVAAGVLFVLPSLFVLIGLSWAYMSLGPQDAAELLYGIRPAVVAIVLFAAWRIGSRVLKRPLTWGLALGALLAATAGLAFPLIVLIAGAIGWFARAQLQAGTAHAAGGTASRPAIIGDDTPPPPHAIYSGRRLLYWLMVALLLWLAGMGLLVGLFGGDQLYPQLGLFFSKAALVTFGGAYAVMPYVFQNAVEQQGWITAAQMVDGLALGETTPGPLIMVVAYIGFVAAWTQQALAGASPLVAGALGACVATFFTFLPSFFFILAGGPLVEHTRADFKLAGPLTAITAAVVGAILYLSVFLAWHVIWPRGLVLAPDWPALLLAIAGLLALVRGWLGMIPVILLSGVAGYLLLLLR